MKSEMDPLLAARVELCAAADVHCEVLILQSVASGIARASASQRSYMGAHHV